jgi:hypothetical protein
MPATYENSGGCIKFWHKTLAENFGGKFWWKILAENIGGAENFRRLTKI